MWSLPRLCPWISQNPFSDLVLRSIGVFFFAQLLVIPTLFSPPRFFSVCPRITLTSPSRGSHFILAGSFFFLPHSPYRFPPRIALPATRHTSPSDWGPAYDSPYAISFCFFLLSDLELSRFFYISNLGVLALGVYSLKRTPPSQGCKEPHSNFVLNCRLWLPIYPPPPFLTAATRESGFYFPFDVLKSV